MLRAPIGVPAVALAFSALVLADCRSTATERTPAETEALLRSRLARVARDDALELWSPVSADASRPFFDTARSEAGLVRALLGAPRDPGVRLYLVPTESQGADKPWMPVAQGAHTAGAFDEGFLFIFVPAGASDHELALCSATSARTLRHEFAHVYAGRTGLLRQPWFHEGLALEVEYGRVDDGAWTGHPYPERFLTARATLGEGALAELLAWRRGEAIDRSRGERLYAHAHTFYRFLPERAGAGTLLERARRIHALSDEEIAELEPAWLDWWSALDPFEIVKRGARSTNAAERAEAAKLLPPLAEAGLPDFASRAADELALELALAGDDATFEPAARFLLFFRHQNLLEDDLGRLGGSDRPAVRLVAAALRSRRGEPVDLEHARRDHAALSTAERDGLLTVTTSIAGLAPK